MSDSLKYKPPEEWQRKFDRLGTNDENVLGVLFEVGRWWCMLACIWLIVMSVPTDWNCFFCTILVNPCWNAWLNNNFKS